MKETKVIVFNVEGETIGTVALNEDQVKFLHWLCRRNLLNEDLIYTEVGEIEQI